MRNKQCIFKNNCGDIKSVRVIKVISTMWNIAYKISNLLYSGKIKVGYIVNDVKMLSGISVMISE